MTETHDAFVELADLFKELPETFTDEFKEVTPQAQLQGYRHLGTSRTNRTTSRWTRVAYA